MASRKRRRPENRHIGSSLESLFKELGEFREFRALTLKKVGADIAADELRARKKRKSSRSPRAAK